MKTRIELGTSGVKALRTCEQKFVYSEVERLQPRWTNLSHNSPMEVGSWVHLALAAHYTGRDWHATLARLEQEMDPTGQNQYVKSISRKTHRLVESYLYHYNVLCQGKGYEDFEVVGVEVPAFIDVVVGDDSPATTVRARATIDLIGRDRDGLLFVLEHKTGGKFPYSSRTSLIESQVTMQLLAARASGYPVEYAVYNWISTKEPTIPQITKAGALSRRTIETDLPTFFAAMLQMPSDEWTDDIYETMEVLSDPDQSPFFRRLYVRREPQVELLTLRDHVRDGIRAQKLHEQPKKAVRIFDAYICDRCSYVDLCFAEARNAPSAANIRETSYQQRYDNRSLLT